MSYFDDPILSPENWSQFSPFSIPCQSFLSLNINEMVNNLRFINVQSVDNGQLMHQHQNHQIIRNPDREPFDQPSSPIIRPRPEPIDQDIDDSPEIDFSKMKDQRKYILRGVNDIVLQSSPVHPAYITLYGGEKTLKAFKRNNKFFSTENTFRLIQAVKHAKFDPTVVYGHAIQSYERKRARKYGQYASYRQKFYKDMKEWIPKMAQLPHNASFNDIKLCRFAHPTLEQ